jgi:hypothetical protein
MGGLACCGSAHDRKEGNQQDPLMNPALNASQFSNRSVATRRRNVAQSESGSVASPPHKKSIRSGVPQHQSAR